MNALRESFFQALKSSAKQVIAKSAADPLLMLRNKSGAVVGFATAEPVSPAEAQRIAELQHPNHVFDGSAAFPFDDSPARETVSKAVPDPNDKNACLTHVFPFADVSKSVPDGGELMNRVSGTNRDTTEYDRPGRPATARKQTPLSRFDVKNPQTVLEVEGENIVAGSVLAVVMPDGTVSYICLKADCPAEVIMTGEQ